MDIRHGRVVDMMHCVQALDSMLICRVRCAQFYACTSPPFAVSKNGCLVARC